MAKFKKVPKGCGRCSNQSLDLTNLVARCMKCGWSTNLASVNEFIDKMRKRSI